MSRTCLRQFLLEGYMLAATLCHQHCHQQQRHHDHLHACKQGSMTLLDAYSHNEPFQKGLCPRLFCTVSNAGFMPLMPCIQSLCNSCEVLSGCLQADSFVSKASRTSSLHNSTDSQHFVMLYHDWYSTEVSMSNQA